MNKTIDLISTVLFYNSLESYMIEVEHTIQGFNGNDCDINYNYEKWDNEQWEVIWIMLVKEYGDYGTSPRFGWIQDTQRLKRDLDDNLEYQDVKLSYLEDDRE